MCTHFVSVHHITQWRLNKHLGIDDGGPVLLAGKNTLECDVSRRQSGYLNLRHCRLQWHVLQHHLQHSYSVLHTHYSQPLTIHRNLCSRHTETSDLFKHINRTTTLVFFNFYSSVICPVLEYACPAWHTSLTQQQTRQIKSTQKRALRIIFNSNCIDYENFCIIHQLQTLAERRTELCQSF